MDFRFGGELPDDHVFLTRIRPLVDWTFKLFSWLLVTSTFGIAAEVTKSPWLWAIYGLSQLFILLFLQSFFDWVFTMKFPKWSKKKPAAPPAVGWRKYVRSIRRAAIAIFAFLIWTAFQIGMQQAIGRTVDAIAQFQKSKS